MKRASVTACCNARHSAVRSDEVSLAERNLQRLNGVSEQAPFLRYLRIYANILGDFLTINFNMIE